MKYGQLVIRNKDLTSFLKAPRNEVQEALRIYRLINNNNTYTYITGTIKHRHIYYRTRKYYQCLICRHYISRL